MTAPLSTTTPSTHSLSPSAASLVAATWCQTPSCATPVAVVRVRPPQARRTVPSAASRSDLLLLGPARHALHSPGAPALRRMNPAMVNSAPIESGSVPLSPAPDVCSHSGAPP